VDEKSGGIGILGTEGLDDTILDGLELRDWI